MSDCSKHKKEVAGISDMKVLAEMIGDLHYETLMDLFTELSIKFYKDGLNDIANGKKRLGYTLKDTSHNILAVAKDIEDAWQISKPFMKDQTNQP